MQPHHGNDGIDRTIPSDLLPASSLEPAVNYRQSCQLRKGRSVKDAVQPHGINTVVNFLT